MKKEAYIELFLHSHCETGEYLGFESVSDVFSCVNFPIESINKDLNVEIGCFITSSFWREYKDNVFRVGFVFDDCGPDISGIEVIIPFIGER